MTAQVVGQYVTHSAYVILTIIGVLVVIGVFIQKNWRNRGYYSRETVRSKRVKLAEDTEKEANEANHYTQSDEEH
ncbi:EYxxD motif small membrane protein [Bacillus horti]|uniref:Uncharacterized protein n=1 Tax=Caldalkalibacillus horti TaxID=77523 RepID=A0ABT9VU11_9BACI|nr:EYxxD motif small membrane protein [Bacillus horti]MDQ0164476.1 hypothetical protein [Bacillus horti]